MFNQAIRNKFENDEEAITEWVLIPLIEAYRIIKEDIDANIGENKITEKIIRNVKKNSSISQYIDKHIINVKYRPKEILDAGDIKEPDITFFIPVVCEMHIEAKRIYKNGTVSDYCGKTGLGEFLSGNYSSNEDNGGMIAYIQEGQLSDIQKEIIGKVNGCNCIELTENIGIDNSFLSIHERNTNRDIRIYHLLFDFV